MEACNGALLEKQVWLLIKNENLLMARLLKAKYYYDCDIFFSPVGFSA